MNQVIESFRSGSEAALALLIEEESTRMLRFIRSCVRSAELADEIFQESWLEAWRSREKLREVERFRSWLYRITRNTIHDTLLREHCRVDVVLYGDWDEDTLLAPDRAPSSRVVAQRRQWREIVDATMAELDPDTQELITMKFYAELRFREIAEMKNMPLGTVTSKVQRALVKMRRMLSEKGIGSPGQVMDIEPNGTEG